MKKKIETIFSSEKEITSASEDFYRNYWSENTEIKQQHFQQNKSIIENYFVAPIRDKNILEIGVGGEGGIIISLQNANRVQGVDISDSAIKNCKNFGLPVAKCNLDKDTLKFEDNCFDIVFAFEVFEHFANPQHALEEIKRVLKPDGKLLISIPNETTHHWPRLFYPTLFEKENFKEFLMTNDFKLISDQIFPLYQNIYVNKITDPALTVWSHYFLSQKINKNDSQKYFDLAMYFWKKRNKKGLRIRPIEAIDLFRKSYFSDKTNLRSKLYLTRALIYRFLLGEKEEFEKMFNEIISVTNEILISTDNEKIAELLYFYIALQTEGNYFGLSILSDDHKSKFVNMLSKLPDAEHHVGRLKSLVEIYNN